jgi:nucleotide-binding universal stress UspA family protein
MLTLRTIVCPIDFSETSRHALRWAVALAVRRQSRLTIVAAVEPLLAEAARVRLQQDLRTETRSVLKEFVDPVISRVQIAYELEVDIGHAPDLILAAASRQSADLIVMGTRGIGGLQKLLVGSTTERVLRRTRIPILAVPDAADQSDGSADATAATPIVTVLVGTDFSEASANAIRWASDIARTHAALLLVTHIVRPLIMPVEWTGHLEDVNNERLAAARAQLEAQSGEAATDLQTENLVTLGQPVESIAAIAETRKVSLIVMGLTGTDRTLAPRPGSTAYGVVSSVHVPVLVVPAV